MATFQDEKIEECVTLAGLLLTFLLNFLFLFAELNLLLFNLFCYFERDMA